MIDMDPEEVSMSMAMDLSVGVGPAVGPAPIASPSRPPPPPPPKVAANPLLDQETRHIVLPKSADAKAPTPPQSWSAEEGTAAIMLPGAHGFEDTLTPTPTPAPSSRTLVASGSLPGAARPNRSARPMVLATIVGGLVALLSFAAGHYYGASPAAPPPADQQVLIDQALFAVQTGHIAQAVEILERFQRAQPAADPIVDSMIAALKRRTR